LTTSSSLGVTGVCRLLMETSILDLLIEALEAQA
jgi:hypothetical protein